jgi:hypothetical protein
MSGFVVDSRTLLAVRDTLGRLHDQLVGMHTVVWHEWGTLGGLGLESELEHFCGTWHYGVSELGGQLQDLTRRLGEASDAYERIEQRITQAGGGSGSGAGAAPVGATGSGHTTPTAHHPAAKHTSAPRHTAKHSDSKHHSDAGGAGGPGTKHYSGGVGLAPAPAGSGGAGHSGETHGGGDKHEGGKKHPGVGSGTTVIGGGPDHGGGGSDHGGGSPHGGRHHPSSGSGSGTTVIGGGPTQTTGSGGSGTTTIDEKIHHAEDRQRAELASVLRMVKD